MCIIVREFYENLGRLGHDGQHRFAIGNQGGVWVVFMLCMNDV